MSNSTPPLAGSHLRAYEEIFRHLDQHHLTEAREFYTHRLAPAK